MLIQCTSVCSVNLIPSAVKGFCLPVELAPFHARFLAGLLTNAISIGSPVRYCLGWEERRESKETQGDSHWFSGSNPQPVPYDITRHLRHCLPPKFKHPHTLSSLEEDFFPPCYWFSLLLSPLRHIFVTLEMGKIEVQCIKAICSSIPLTSDRSKNKT